MKQKQKVDQAICVISTMPCQQ